MKSAKSLLAALVLLGATISVQATPLRLDYTTTNIGGGLFEYQFELSVDNNDGSFVAGQGWRGLIFGDQLGAPSLIADFAMTSPVPAPWETLGATASLTSHNGPTFAPLFTYWRPSLGDTLLWSGTSATEVPQGQLFFSTFNFAGTVNGGVAADFEVAHHVGSFSSSVPDAGQSLVLMMLGLGGLAGIGILRRERSISKAMDIEVVALEHDGRA